MAMVKPIADKVNAFDATQAYTFTFEANGGAQVYKNKITIRDNTTNEVVFTETITSYDFTHTVPADTLENGEYYNYTIITYDVSNNASDESDPVTFYCLEIPTLTFSNMPNDGIIQASSFSFSVTYDQEQSDTLNYLRINLYDTNNQLIDSSGDLNNINTPPVTLSHSFTGFDNNTQYKIQATCETTLGVVYTTPLYTFIARYQNPSSFSLLELDNDVDKGRIKITSNTASINATMVDGNGDIISPKYGILIHDGTPDTEWIEWEEDFTPETGSTVISEWGNQYMLDLSHDGETLIWENGIYFPENFAIQTWFYPTGDGLISSFTSTNGGIYVYYRVGIPYGETVEKSYIEVEGLRNGTKVLSQRSSYVDRIPNESYCTYVIKKGSSGWSVDLDVLATASHSLLNWGGDSNVPYDYESNIPYENNSATAETVEYIAINNNLDGIFPLTKVSLMNGRYDNFYSTKDATYTEQEELPSWDYNTILACDFNANVNGGNVGFIVSQINKVRVKRRKYGTYKWITLFDIPITSEGDLHFTQYDNYIPTGETYEYCLAYVMNDGTEGISVSDKITTKFNGIYITDGIDTYKFISGYTLSAIQNKSIGLLQPLNNPVPITVSNSSANYLSGMTSTTLLGYDYEDTRVLDRINIAKQTREYLAFLTNGRAKILKDWNGNIWLIRLSATPTVTPNMASGNGIVDIGFSWVEQGKYDNPTDLYNNRLITVRN